MSAVGIDFRTAPQLRTYEGVGRPVLMCVPDDAAAQQEWMADGSEQACAAPGCTSRFHTHHPSR
jgi:hypothetical protein